MKAEILGEHINHKQKCCSFLLDYFEQRSKNSSCDFDMLMLLDDLASDGYCDTNQVKELLEREIKRPYPAADRKAIESRLQQAQQRFI